MVGDTNTVKISFQMDISFCRRVLRFARMLLHLGIIKTMILTNLLKSV